MRLVSYAQLLTTAFDLLAATLDDSLDWCSALGHVLLDHSGDMKAVGLLHAACMRYKMLLLFESLHLLRGSWCESMVCHCMKQSGSLSPAVDTVRSALCA